jgi:hypothetical protein
MEVMKFNILMFQSKNVNVQNKKKRFTKDSSVSFPGKHSGQSTSDWHWGVCCIESGNCLCPGHGGDRRP